MNIIGNELPRPEIRGLSGPNAVPTLEKVNCGEFAAVRNTAEKSIANGARDIRREPAQSSSLARSR
jgi:hypothetical protein